MTDDYIYPENMNSARRLWLLARYMYPTLKKQMWLYPVAIIAYFIIVSIIACVTHTYVGPDIVTGIFLSSLFYFAPVALSARDNRLMTAQLPVNAGEKQIFLYLYFMIVVPVLMIAATMVAYGLCMIWGDTELNNMLWNMMTNYCDDLTENKGLIVFNLISAPLLLTITIYPMVKGSNNRVLHAVVAFFLAMFSIMLVSGMAGFLVGFYEGFNERPYNPDSTEISSVTTICSSIVLIFLMIAAIIIMRKTYKILNNRGF